MDPPAIVAEFSVKVLERVKSFPERSGVSTTELEAMAEPDPEAVLSYSLFPVSRLQLAPDPVVSVKSATLESKSFV